MKSKDPRKLRRMKERQEKKQRNQKSSQKPKNNAPVEKSSGWKKRPHHSAETQNSKRPKVGAQNNKFMEMIQEQANEGHITLTTSKIKTKSLKTNLSAEDAALKKLEANLGVTKANGKTKLNEEFAKDGLGDDFGDFLFSLDNLSKKLKNEDSHDEMSESGSENEEEEEIDDELQQEMDLLAKEDTAFIDAFDDLPTDDEEDDDDLAQFDTENEESDDETDQNTLANARISSSEGFDADSGLDDEEIQVEEAQDDESDVEDIVEEEVDSSEEQDENDQEARDNEEDVAAVEVVEEDIYGRPKVPQVSATGRYVPPHLRRAATSNEESLREIRRRINGQLNRLSESNMESIALEFESIYRGHVRADVNRVLLEALVASCCHQTQLMTQLISVSTALLGALFHSIGTETVGFFIEHFVQKFHEKVLEAREISNEDETTSKESSNLLLMITNLYAYETVHCTLVYDLFRFLVESFQSIDVELLLLLLQHSGPTLRSDDSSALTDMIAAVQVKATQHKEGRAQFLLELISNLKKSKGKQISEFSAERRTQLRKWIGRVKSRVGHSNNALRVSLKELLEADAKGRWWIIGGTWIPPTQQASSEKNEKQKSSLLRLAEKQRMNTDVRRSIFCAIMGASDCLEAYDAVLKLGLKDKQEREIIRVILHCCGQELKYNPYYSLLAIKFANNDSRYKFTLQLAYWDIFKQMHEWKPRKIYNMACLLVNLLESNAMTLACLKVLDFTNLSSIDILFLKVLFEKILLNENEIKIIQIFERIEQQKSKMTATRDGITVFLHQHMLTLKFKDSKGKSRVKMAISVLDSLGKTKN